MNLSDVKRWLCLMGCMSVLVGCGGGSSSRNVQTPAPTSTTQIAKGAVSGFGSVFVNGVEWETDDCDFRIDDEVGDETQLEIGDIVEVEGTIDDNNVAHCTSMEYDSELEGLITEIGVDYILVHGLRVDINDDTVFDDDLPNRDITDLAVGDYVEVSAFSRTDGYIATRIDLEVDDGEVEIYGKVENLDSTTSTFTIHELTVNFAGASFDDFEGKDLEDGDYVEIEGESSNSDDELVATSVEYKDNNPFDDGEEGDEFEVEGYLSIVDGNLLMLNDFEIVLADNVEYEHGSADDLVDGAKVEVEGMLNADGQLIVSEVKFKIGSSIEIEAPLDGAPEQDADSGGWSVSLLGRSILITDETQFEDSSEMDQTFFDVEDLAAGDWLEVKVFENDNGEFVAVSVEREDDSDTVELEGLLRTIAGDLLTIAGFEVIVDDQTIVPEGFTLSSFIESLEPGVSELEVEGEWLEGSIVAREIMFED